MDMSVLNKLAAAKVKDGIFIVDRNGVTEINDDNHDRQVRIYSNDGWRVIETTIDDWETTEMKIETVIRK